MGNVFDLGEIQPILVCLFFGFLIFIRSKISHTKSSFAQEMKKVRLTQVRPKRF